MFNFPLSSEKSPALCPRGFLTGKNMENTRGESQHPGDTPRHSSSSFHCSDFLEMSLDLKARSKDVLLSSAGTFPSQEMRCKLAVAQITFP